MCACGCDAHLIIQLKLLHCLVKQVIECDDKYCNNGVGVRATTLIVKLKRAMCKRMVKCDITHFLLVSVLVCMANEFTLVQECKLNNTIRVQARARVSVGV